MYKEKNAAGHECVKIINALVVVKEWSYLRVLQIYESSWSQGFNLLTKATDLASFTKKSKISNFAGVMLSHDNIYWTAMCAAEHIKLREYVEVMVSYLPLSHVAANMVDIW